MRPLHTGKRILTPALAALLIAAAAFAQSARPRITVSPTTATVGDRITLRITVPGADSEAITWPSPAGGELGGFTLLRADTLTGKKEQKRFGGPTLEWTVAAFDTGSVSTGPLTMGVAGDTMRMEGARVTIASVLSDTTGRDLRPFKAQEELPITFFDLLHWFGPWLAGAAALAALLMILRRYLRRRRRDGEGAEQIVPAVPPHEEAKRALDELKRDNPLAKGFLKEYVSRLGLIVKRLLERTHMDPVLEMTTSEVRRWLQDERVLCDPGDVLAILEAGDQVKFARGALDKASCDDLLRRTERIVEAYTPPPDSEFDNEVARREHEEIARAAEEMAANESSSARSRWRTKVPGGGEGGR